MGRVIGLFSSKGGVGKTTVTANLGVALRDLGFKVLLVDSHVLGADLGAIFGLIRTPTHMLDYLTGLIPAEKVIYEEPRTGVHIMPGPFEIEKWKAIKAINEKLLPLKSKYDFILVDTPPWLGSDTAKIQVAVDEAIIVAQPTLLGLLEAMRTKKVLERRTKVKGVVLNMVRYKPWEINAKQFEEELSLPVIASIPEDEVIRKALALRTPAYFFRKGRSYLAFRRLASLISGVEVQEERKGGILSRLFAIFGKRK